MGLLADAERSYQKAIEIHPGYENGYFGLGLVREGRGDDAGAENAYRRGLAKIPRSLPLAYRLAIVSGKLNRPSASEDWHRALSLGGRVCSVRTDYAGWLVRSGRAEEAARQAREALRYDSNCAGAWRVLAGEAERRGRLLARELALEKAFRASKSAEDRSALELLAREDPGYAARFRSVTGRK